MKKLLASYCLIAVGLSPLAQSAEINLKGFASFIGGTTTEGGVDYGGYTNELTFQRDSLIAMQMDADLDDKVTATMQLIARGENDYEANVEWAYVSYKINDTWKLNAGRIRIPFYRYSDFLDVRYAYHWIKAPSTVYGFEIPGYDGLSLVHNSYFGDWDSMLQLVYGSLDNEIGGADLKFENMAGLNWTITRDWLTFRTSYFSNKVTYDAPDFNSVTTVVDGVGQGLGVDLSQLQQDILLFEDVGYFLGLAIGIDHSNVVFDAEYIQYDTDESLLPETDAFYVSLGYRFESFQPYITYSKEEGKSNADILNLVPTSIASIPAVPIPGGPVLTLPQFLGSVLAGAETDNTISAIGFRYDFHHSAAFKLSAEQIENIDNTKVKLVRFGVDLVF